MGEAMEALPNWLEAAVAAAGMTTVYNADDWMRLEQASSTGLAAAEAPSTLN